MMGALRNYARLAAGRRPLPGARVAPAPRSASPRGNIFSDRWLILEHVAGDMPDMRACALVAKTLRGALLSGYQRVGLGNDIPEVVSGHDANGSPTRAAHLAIIPLSFTGFPYADGHVIGFALVPPKDSAILEDETFRKVLRMLAPIDEERGRRVLALATRSKASSDWRSQSSSRRHSRRPLESGRSVRRSTRDRRKFSPRSRPSRSIGISRRKAKRAWRRRRPRSRAAAAILVCRNRKLSYLTSTLPSKARHRPILRANRHAGRTGA